MDSMKEISLWNKGKIVNYVLVDDEDFEWISSWKWFKCQSGYARRKGLVNEGSRHRKHIYMHKEIMTKYFGSYEYTNKQFTDHKDNNRLNNQKSNLRICTPSQNAQNMKKQARKLTSLMKGVDIENIYTCIKKL